MEEKLIIEDLFEGGGHMNYTNIPIKKYTINMGEAF